MAVIVLLSLLLALGGVGTGAYVVRPLPELRDEQGRTVARHTHRGTHLEQACPACTLIIAYSLQQTQRSQPRASSAPVGTKTKAAK